MPFARSTRTRTGRPAQARRTPVDTSPPLAARGQAVTSPARWRRSSTTDVRRPARRRGSAACCCRRQRRELLVAHLPCASPRRRARGRAPAAGSRKILVPRSRRARRARCPRRSSGAPWGRREGARHQRPHQRRRSTAGADREARTLWPFDDGRQFSMPIARLAPWTSRRTASCADATAPHRGDEHRDPHDRQRLDRPRFI